MEPELFDALARALSGARSRRRTLAALAAAPFGFIDPNDVWAKKRPKTSKNSAPHVEGKKKRKKKNKKNKKKEQPPGVPPGSSGTPPPTTLPSPPPGSSPLEIRALHHCAPYPNSAFVPEVTMLTANLVTSCEEIPRLYATTRLTVEEYNDQAQEWQTTTAQPGEIGLTVGSFAFKQKSFSGGDRSDSVPIGFDPATNILTTCAKSGIGFSTVPSGQVCVQANVEFSLDLKQRVYRADWPYNPETISERCRTSVDQWTRDVDLHEGQHVLDQREVVAWYTGEWATRECFGCAPLSPGGDLRIALDQAGDALIANITAAVGQVEALIQTDIDVCAVAFHALDQSVLLNCTDCGANCAALPCRDGFPCRLECYNATTEPCLLATWFSLDRANTACAGHEERCRSTCIERDTQCRDACAGAANMNSCLAVCTGRDAVCRKECADYDESCKEAANLGATSGECACDQRYPCCSEDVCASSAPFSSESSNIKRKNQRRAPRRRGKTGSHDS